MGHGLPAFSGIMRKNGPIEREEYAFRALKERRPLAERPPGCEGRKSPGRAADESKVVRPRGARYSVSKAAAAWAAR